MSIKRHIEKKKLVEVSARHIPSTEYQNLDKTMDPDAGYPFLTSFYGRGVLIFLYNIGSRDEENRKTEREFPVLFKLLKKMDEHDVDLLDLDEEGTTLEYEDTYDWENGDKVTLGLIDPDGEAKEVEADDEGPEESVHPDFGEVMLEEWMKMFAREIEEKKRRERGID